MERCATTDPIAIDKTEKYVKEIKAFAHHLLEGIAYYRNLAKRITKTEEKIFIDQLSQHEAEVQRIITNADFPTA